MKPSKKIRKIHNRIQSGQRYTMGLMKSLKSNKKPKYSPMSMTLQDFESLVSDIWDKTEPLKNYPFTLFTCGHFFKNDAGRLYKRLSLKDDWQEITIEEFERITKIS